MSFSAQVKHLAQSLGFDACNVCRVDEAWEAGERLEAFVEDGRHGQMEWMETTLARRKMPTAMWEGAKSGVVVAMTYGPDHNPLEMLEHKSHGNISVYARGRDYHDTLKKRLKQLARGFVEETGAEVKVFVDTAPLMEKPLAAKAGLGWQGKHTNVVSREIGNWFFLGVMLTDAELEADELETDHCGSCSACVDACPTNAFPVPYQLDARRCISYLTIEHAGPIPAEFRGNMGNRIYGCDDCLAACPWNKFAQTASEAAFHARVELKAPTLGELAALDDAMFREVFSGSPIKRSGRERMVRNVCIAIGNSGDVELVPVLVPLLTDELPTVRGAAVWALACLDNARFEAERDRLMRLEQDPYVLMEWAQDAE